LVLLAGADHRLENAASLGAAFIAGEQEVLTVNDQFFLYRAHSEHLIPASLELTEILRVAPVLDSLAPGLVGMPRQVVMFHRHSYFHRCNDTSAVSLVIQHAFFIAQILFFT
jgi:hypothetical protein